MKKIIAALVILFMFCLRVYSLDIPLFNMPPNSYKLFKHNESMQQAIEKKQQTASQNTVDIQISGIFKFKEQYFVLINHRICKKGDKVKGYTIEKIENNSVTFLKNGKESKQMLNPFPKFIFFTDGIVSNDNYTKH